ncbi:uncharacterized protein G2W53_020810 [Senna tora]|uniref:Uncharacterized protein n=1 Tax=Senna tora TaxID=362788 RepID=A0A834WKH5_9FABA|nr:uncharacterized protein G2W53_020810 [Senna tora]
MDGKKMGHICTWLVIGLVNKQHSQIPTKTVESSTTKLAVASCL